MWTCSHNNKAVILCNGCKEKGTGVTSKMRSSQKKPTTSMDFDVGIDDLNVDDNPWCIDPKRRSEAQARGYVTGCLCCLKSFPPKKNL